MAGVIPTQNNERGVSAMSVYGTVQTEINDMSLLCAVLDELGLDYEYDPSGQLSYHKWHRPKHARGNDATVVIGKLNGGLDTTPRRYCGDTAFVSNGDGTFRAEIDIAHGNAPSNWQAIQNLYAVKLAERGLPRGYKMSYALDRSTGHVTGSIIPGVVGTTPARKGLQR